MTILVIILALIFAVLVGVFLVNRRHIKLGGNIYIDANKFNKLLDDPENRIIFND